jgi:hypothetical protein
MVEIFKTNVNNKRLANRVLKSLRTNLPACHFNFDLDDCDRILRAQCLDQQTEILKIIQLVKGHHIEICLLEG